MRRTIFTMIFSFLATQLPAQTGKFVELIQETVELINKDTLYTTRTLDNEQFLEQMTDGGGQLTGYFKNRELIKVIRRIGLSSCVTTYEYFLQNNTLIFVYGQEKVFPYVDSIGTFDYTTLVPGMECRFYFRKEVLIKSIFTGQTRCTKQPTDAQAPELLVEIKRYAGLLKE